MRAAEIERELKLPGQLRVYVRRDGVALDLSQSRVVENDDLSGLLAALETWGRGFWERAVSRKPRPEDAAWIRELICSSFPEERADGMPKPFFDRLLAAEVFRNERGEPLSLKRIAEMVRLWGYDLVLGDARSIPAFRVEGDPKDLDFLRQLFRR